jgi:ankyrin repeat protein
MIGATPLMFAAMKGEPGMVAFLLEKGAKVDARTRGEKTALDLARDADIKALLARRRNQVNFPP